MRPISQRGQVYPLFAFFLIPLLAVSALSVDVGYYRYQQRLLQTAADSAAITGAQQSLYSSSSSTITTAAENDAATNGFTNGKGNVAIAVDSTFTDNYTTNGGGGQQTSGSGTGVKVTITKSYGRFFGGFFFAGKQKISTSAVAIVKLTPAGASCLTGLGPAPDVNTDNGAKIVGPNCGIATNGDITCNGGTIDVNFFAYNAAAADNCTSPTFTAASPAPSSAIVDPCQTYTGCAYIQNKIDGNSPDNKCASATKGASIGSSSSGKGKGGGSTTQVGDGKGTDGTSSFTLGSYMCFNGATFTNVNFAPGFYVLENGVQFAGTITGTGVTFYIDNDTGCACSTASDVIDMSTSGATISFTAPTSTTKATDGSSGTDYQGMVVYQNPSGLSGITPGCKNGGGTELNCVEISATVGGTCPPGTTGVWYMPYSSFLFNGHNNDCFTGNLIFDDARINGGGNQVSIYPPSGSTPSIEQYVAFLVE